MVRQQDITEEDHAFLDSVLEAALRAVEEGRPVDLAGLVGEKVHLRGEVESLIAMARGSAAVTPDDVGMPRISGYTLLHEIGRGGMGTVYLARQERLGGRVVALKVLPEGHSLSRRSRDRFAREAMVVAKLQHPNIVAVHDVVRDERTHAYAMEYVDGATLGSLIQRIALQSGFSKTRSRADRSGEGRIAMETVRECLGARREALPEENYTNFICRIGLAVARALTAVHAAGLIHRDVKPSNILLRRDGTPLLSDFGLVRDVDLSFTTQAGHFVGTPAYASPEQLRGGDLPAVAGASSGAANPRDELDHRSDIYSLGVTLYHALTFHPPFEGRSTIEILREIENGKTPMLRSSDPRLPRDLETIIAKAMDPEPDRRYHTATDLADDLARFLHSEPIRARPPTTAYLIARFSARHKALVGGVIVAFVLLIAGLVGTSIGLGKAKVAQALAEHNESRAILMAQESRLNEYASRIQAAAAALQADDVPTMREQLLRAPEDLRGWEWNYLLGQSDKSVRTVARMRQADATPEFGNTVWGITSSPDGSRLLVVSETMLAIVDPRTGEIISDREISSLVPDFRISGTAWLPPGDRIVIGTPARELHVLEAATLLTMRTIAIPTAEFRSLIFAPTSDGGRLLVYAPEVVDSPRRIENRFFVYDTMDWERTPIRCDPLASVSGLAVYPDGSRIVARTHEDTVIILDTETGRTTSLPAQMMGGGQGCDSAAVSPDGTLIATGSKKATQLWDARSLQLLANLAPESPFKWHILTFSANGRFLYSRHGPRIVVWDVATRQQVTKIPWREVNMGGFAASPDGETMYLGTTDGTIEQLSLSAAPDPLDVAAREGGCIAPDFSFVAYADARRAREGKPDLLDFHDFRTGARTAVALGSLDFETHGAAAISPDGRYVVMEQQGGPKNGPMLLSRLDRSTGEIVRREFPPGHRLQISGSCSGVLMEIGGVVVSLVSIVDLTTLEQHEEKGVSAVGHGCVSPDGSLFAVRVVLNDGSSVLRLRQTAGGTLRHELASLDRGEHSFGRNVFSPDSATLAACGSESDRMVIRLWDVRTGRIIGAAPIGDVPWPGLCFAPDGRRLAVGQLDGTIRLLALLRTEGRDELLIKEVLSLRGDYWMSRPMFSDDGTRLGCVTVYPANRCVVWDARPIAQRLRNAEAVTDEPRTK